jgi:uncharacterized protein (TIGR02266 family)
MGEDKRRHPREPIALVVEYEGADDLAGDYTANLSRGGTFVRTTREFAAGDDIDLCLSFPGLLDPIPLRGVVRWTRDDEDECGVGIEFVGRDEVDRLGALLDRLRAGDPALVKPVTRVMVVEDNPHVARLIRDGLSGSARRAFGESVLFHFETASNGKDALARLRARRADALIIDIYLPVMDGVQVIEAVRADPALRELPIIAVSAGGRAARDSALAAGADFFLGKPMRLREIIDTMRKLMVVADPAPRRGEPG